MDYDVNSLVNSRVKRLVRLKDRKHRDQESVFVVEEPRIIERALTSGHHPREVYWCPAIHQQVPIDGVDIFTIAEDAIHKASYRKRSTGVIAVFDYLDRGLGSVSTGDRPLLFVAEGLEKPGNLGALLRIADAAGVDGVIVIGDGADLFNPNVVRTSTGAIFTVPVGLSADVAALGGWLSSQEIESFAAVPDAGQSLWATDLSGGAAIWIGAEAEGLSPQARALVDHEVSIPMAGAADSLNASSAAAVIVFEAVRQRTQ